MCYIVSSFFTVNEKAQFSTTSSHTSAMMTTAPQQHPTPPPRDLAQAASTPSCPLSAVLPPGAARGAVEASAVLAAASTERRPLRALRRELSATDIRIIAEPSSSAARQHGRSVRTEQSVSSGSRFYANVVVKLHREHTAREQARTNDEWLADVRSRQRQQRERRAQKEQSDY